MYLSGGQTITTKRLTEGCVLAEYLGTYVLNECEKKTEVLYVTGYRFVLKWFLRVALTRVMFFLSRGIRDLDLENATNLRRKPFCVNWSHFEGQNF